MREILLVRFGEVYLKGLNRPLFMRALVDRVRHAAEPFGGHVWLKDSRIYVSDMNDTQACARRVAQVFGIHSVSIAKEMEKDDFEAVCQAAIEMMADKSGSFKVRASRSDKKYPYDSPQINEIVGGRVLEANPNLHVDVKNPDYTLVVEIREKATLHIGRIEGAGGMPMGTAGKACLLLSGGIDSPVAGYMIARRGVRLMAVHFHSFPYTSERARDKVIELARILSTYCGKIDLFIVPFTEMQMKIHQHCPEEMTTLIMRRQMMRIAERLALRERAQALVTGESLGQVASQTMEAIASTDDVATLSIFRPLIGFDKIDIINYAEKIGTYETSSLPYEDCCTVFTPKHPLTRPKLEDVREGESRLGEEMETMLQACVDGAEKVIVEDGVLVKGPKPEGEAEG